jgi:hypothetical protein
MLFLFNLCFSQHYLINNYQIGSCPYTHPVLCDENYRSMGSCRKDKAHCNENHPYNIVPLGKEDNNVSKYYSYDQIYFGNSCFNLKQNYKKIFTNPQKLPRKFKMLTINILGLEKPGMVEALQMNKRLNRLADITDSENLDIIFFQEVSDTAFKTLKSRMKGYVFSEQNFNMSNASLKRNSKMDLFGFFKYTPQSVEIYSIGGNSGYDNSIMIVVYPNIVLLNVYLQAGSKFSPGLEHRAIHYSRCRSEQLQVINSIVKNFYNKNKESAIVVAGDFNTDLDGNWPEYREISKLNLDDSFRKLYPHKPGYTEDTDTNLMRWNAKFQKKSISI